MKILEIEQSFAEYEEVFIEFCQRYKIHPELFNHSDHFAIKCADEDDYLETIDTIEPHVLDETKWVHEESSRKLYSAELKYTIGLSIFNFEIIEVMQPRPGKELKKGFVEHTEFYVLDINRALGRLSLLGLDNMPEIQMNDSHKWVNLVIDSAGREIKFNDLPLKEVVENEKSENNAKTEVYLLDDWRG